jgi:lysophospholipase L1-like esterase
MPDLSLLIASVIKPVAIKEVPPTPPAATAPAPTPASCATLTHAPENTGSRPCPQFSPVASPIPSSYPQKVAAASPVIPQIRTPELTLPALLPSPLAANPYLPLQPTWTNYVRPRSGSQLYQQRLEALRQGKTYTRLPADSFSEVWANVSRTVTYEEWIALLKREATSMAKGQGKNRLTVILGDSISQWLPLEQLATDRFYLNQGISGDTTGGVLKRLAAIDEVRPDTIYVMVGVNDLKNGKTDREILGNLQKIMQRLRQVHPQAQVIVNSVLPTRLPSIPTDRVTPLNQKIAQLAQQEGVGYLALTSAFADESGILRQDLTTDGIHLSAQGYAVWGGALRSLEAVTTARLIP